MLFIFIYGNVTRLEIALFRPIIHPEPLRVRIFWMSLNLAVVLGLFLIAFFIIDSVIKAIIDLQTR
jgi:predicted Abi (CAAX) family protease